MRSERVNKQSWDFPYHSEKLFEHEMRSKGSTNIVKVLSFSFEHCVGLFTILLVEGFSERGLFRHLSEHVFRSPSVQKYISDGGHLFVGNVQNWI